MGFELNEEYKMIASTRIILDAMQIHGLIQLCAGVSGKSVIKGRQIE